MEASSAVSFYRIGTAVGVSITILLAGALIVFVAPTLLPLAGVLAFFPVTKSNKTYFFVSAQVACFLAFIHRLQSNKLQVTIEAFSKR